MRIIAKTENEEIATVYIAEMQDGKCIEFVESVQPPIPREKKWVLIISTMYGCPIRCPICDAGGYYKGKLTKEEMLAQIDYMVMDRFPDGRVPIEKFKIQFARMGEPALNRNVLNVLQELPQIYEAPGLLPTISTVAPGGCDAFFERLLEIKSHLYKDRFLLQFSIHTTKMSLRDWLIPVKKWDFKAIADYAKDFYRNNDRKITLNFALGKDMPVDPDVLLRHFSPDVFLIKVTPVNPTHQAQIHGIASHIVPEKVKYDIIDALREAGYVVILSIGEWEENHIGSNCGQFITNYLKKNEPVERGYTYPLKELV